MMTDRHAVIWTRIGPVPMKMANLVMTARECRVTYTKEFVDSGLPGMSLMADPAIIRQETLVWTSTENRPLHPRLMAMVPPNHAGNLQRRIYAEILARQPAPPAPGMETEWEMLMFSGHNGIGHLDVFRDDLAASSWYEQRNTLSVVDVKSSRSRLWNLLRDEVRQVVGDHDGLSELANIIGPTPSAGGMITKVLLSIPDPDGGKWTGESLAIDARPIETPFIDVIVKVEEPQYEGLLDLEALCLEVHREAGFEVPRSWRLDIDGLRLLAIERFDRTKEGAPIPLESLMTVFASGSRKIQSTADVLWPDVGKMVAKIGRLCGLDIRNAQENLFRRLAFALMTGNGDMHLDNVAFLGGKQAVRMAPVYDPAPMRAWPRHNMRMAVSIDFEGDHSIYQQIAETATAFGLSVPQGKAILLEAAEATREYCERVMSLVDVPLDRRHALVGIVEKERNLLQIM